MWILDQYLPGDIAGRLPEGVASPTPLSSADLCGECFVVVVVVVVVLFVCLFGLVWFALLLCRLPNVLVCYLLWPLDTESFAQTVVYEVG